ncbi:TTC28 isoform 6, partial [Pan troglodytes]
EQHIASVREALGVESHYSRACASSETESEAGDIMDQQFEEMNNKLNSVTDPTGFLRMVRRNNLFNRDAARFAEAWDWAWTHVLALPTSQPVKAGDTYLRQVMQTVVIN